MLDLEVLLHWCAGYVTPAYDYVHLVWLVNVSPQRKCSSTELTMRAERYDALLPKVIPANHIADALTIATAVHLELRAGIPVTGGLGEGSAAGGGRGNPAGGSLHRYVRRNAAFGIVLRGSCAGVLPTRGRICVQVAAILCGWLLERVRTLRCAGVWGRRGRPMARYSDALSSLRRPTRAHGHLLMVRKSPLRFIKLVHLKRPEYYGLPNAPLAAGTWPIEWSAIATRAASGPKICGRPGAP